MIVHRVSIIFWCCLYIRSIHRPRQAAFAADCLETLEEIADENKEIFLESGGEQFNLVDCLNDHDSHIKMMANLLAPYLPVQD